MSRNSSANNCWTPSKDQEHRKLCNDRGCKLASGILPSRTRGSSVQASTIFDVEVTTNANDAANAMGDEEATANNQPDELFLSPSGTTASTLTTDATTKRGKTISLMHRRATFEVAAVRSLEEYLVCPKCQSSIEIETPTVGIATGLRLKCRNEFCCFLDIKKPTETDFDLPLNAGSPLITRTTDFAVNILFVLSMLCSGDGPTEAGRVLGLCGLPNSTTMQTCNFTNIEQRMSPIIHQLAEECMRMNLEKEVKRSLGNATNDEGVLLFDLWKDQKLPNNQLPKVDFSTDMSWQGRSSGRTYNSLSGHALLVGGKTRLPCCMSIKSKKCNQCTSWHRHHGVDEDVPEHECTLNFEGASGAMEPVAALHMVINAFRDHKVVTRTLVTDDDSSIKAKLKWSNADHMLKHGLTSQPKIVNKNGNEVTRPDKGELPADMEEPSFLADPGHRKKSLKNVIYTLISKKKADRLGCSKMDAIRIGTNFAHMSLALPDKPESEYVNAGKAVIEHHFDNHEYCGNWCRRKALTDEQRKESTKFYRCKTKDDKLYEWLQQKLARFLTLDALKEVGHGMDALMNESFNNTAGWLAPKNKVYSGSLSLRNRIDIAIAITTLGLKLFYERVLHGFGIAITEDVNHFLLIIDNKRNKRIAKTKTNEAKKSRQEKFHQKLKAHTEDATTARAKAEGTYMPGIGMDGGYVEDDFTNNRKRKRSTTTTRTTPVCPLPLCGLKGHKTVRSQKCKYNKKNPNYVGDEAVDDLNNKPAATNNTAVDTAVSTLNNETAQASRDAEECDVMDSQPLDDSSASDAFWSAEEHNDEISDSDDNTQLGML